MKREAGQRDTRTNPGGWITMKGGKAAVITEKGSEPFSLPLCHNAHVRKDPTYMLVVNDPVLGHISAFNNEDYTTRLSLK